MVKIEESDPIIPQEEREKEYRRIQKETQTLQDLTTDLVKDLTLFRQESHEFILTDPKIADGFAITVQPPYRRVVVHRERHFNTALMLTEAYEKRIGEEFILKKAY